jgi:hypothetical protein
MEQYGVQRVKVILGKIVGGGRAIYEYLEKKQDAVSRSLSAMSGASRRNH